jgi:hypothetical protein
MARPRNPARCSNRSGADPSVRAPTLLVSAGDLRRRFAAGTYLQRANEGEFGCCLKGDSTIRFGHQPAGSRNIAVAYLNSLGHRIFVVHFFLIPDASTWGWRIGASGQPDPKWLFEDGVVYWTR